MHRPLTSKPHLVSSVAGPTSTPLEERTLGDFWNAQVKAYPNSPALVSRHEAPDTHSLEYLGGELAGEECLRWSYQQLDREVDSLARGLLKMGVKKGDRVGAYLSNSSPYVLLQWATAKVSSLAALIGVELIGKSIDRRHPRLHQPSVART
jgi:fatty-acyl-CoA synthase